VFENLPPVDEEDARDQQQPRDRRQRRCQEIFPFMRSVARSAVTLPAKTTHASPRNLPMAKPGRIFHRFTCAMPAAVKRAVVDSGEIAYRSKKKHDA
jgi:hypothetical protein